MNDPQTIWQSQPTEELKMSMSQLMQKAQQHRMRSRWIVAANDLACIGFVAFVGFNFVTATNTTSRVGLALLAAGSLYVARRRHKELWPLVVSLDSTPPSGLEAYRSELQRWHDASRDIWRMLAPLIPGCIVFALPGFLRLVRESRNTAFLINALPFCLLLAIWLVLILPMRRRKLRKIQGEIEMLNGLLRSHPNSLTGAD